MALTEAVFVPPNSCRRVAEIIRVHDGDTFRCRTEADEDMQRTWDVRIRLYNAPELIDPGGSEAQAYLQYLLQGTTYVIPYRTARSWNRRVMDVWISSPITGLQLVADLMMKAGHGKPMATLEGLTP